MARKYHPDRSTEEDAEDRFKEIQEAYAVLSDEQKRAQYDRFGHNGPQGSPFGGGGFNINLEDILGGDFFSSFFGGALGAVQPVADQTSSFVTPFRFEMFFLGRNKKSWSTSRNPAKRATERAPKMAS